MLLFARSIALQVCVLLIATHRCNCEDYEYSSEDDEYSSEDGHSHPDYTKYFGAQPAASAVVQNKENPSYLSGFVNPAEFQSFFDTPIVFNEPNTKASTAPQTFAPQPQKRPDPFEALRQSFVSKEAASEADPLKKDYFEESQKKHQQAAESEISPGPHYVSHQIPVPKLFNPDEELAQSKDDVETIPPPLKGKHNKKKVQVSPAREGYDGFKDSFDSFEVLRDTEREIEETKVDPTTYYGVKNANYNTGKSSSTVSQSYPSATGYLASLKIPTTTALPYQRLQSRYLEAATGPTYAENDSKRDGQVESSNNVPENLRNKGCREIASPENSDGMSCFVCEDAANKAKYTQCTYSSNEEPLNQYAGSSLRYSTPVEPPASFRYKRSPGKKSYDNDPYFQVASSNKKYFEDFEKEQRASESKRDKDFHYSPYEPEEYETYSETQSAELLKEPGACQKVDREGMTCTVCKNAKTGGNFEQCSYTSAPKEQKYAYVAEKKYDSEDDDPEESKTVVKQSSEEPRKGETADSPSTSAPVSQYATATKSKIVQDVFPELSAAGTTIDETSEERPETDEESDDEETESDEETDESEENKNEAESSDDGPTYLFNYDELKKDKKLISDDPYNVPEHFAESVKQKKTEEADDDESFDEYHYKLFPGFQKEAAESKQEEQKSQPDENQQDVEEVLAEFAKKDRSSCKKAQKNGMTCFLCVDKHNVQHEECMYIAESKPKATHVAFHEVQRLKDPKNERPVQEESDGEESKAEYLTERPLDAVLPLASETSKRKRFFKKVTTTPLPLEGLILAGAASNVYKTIVPFEKPNRRYARKVREDSQASASAPDSERLEDDESRKKNSEEPEAPKEIDVGDEEGAYSHETKPVYSERFGTTLPKYMVEKTDFEKEFDAASGFD